MPWDFLLILIVLGIVVPWRGAVRIRRLMARPHLTTTDRLALYASTIAFQWFAAATVFWRCVARRISATHLALSLGSSPRHTVFMALLLAAFLALTQITSMRRLAQSPAEKPSFLRDLQLKLLPQNAREQLAFVALVLTAAVCEEFLYRGFIQAAFEDLARGSAILGALSSAAFFSSAHLYQGRRGLATTFVVGIVFSTLRAYTGSLAPGVLAHFAADLVPGLLAPTLVRHTTAAVREPGDKARPE